MVKHVFIEPYPLPLEFVIKLKSQHFLLLIILIVVLLAPSFINKIPYSEDFYFDPFKINILKYSGIFFFLMFVYKLFTRRRVVLKSDGIYENNVKIISWHKIVKADIYNTSHLRVYFRGGKKQKPDFWIPIPCLPDSIDSQRILKTILTEAQLEIKISKTKFNKWKN